MAWVEVVAERRQRNRTYQDDADPQHRALDCTLAALHYPSVLDSEVYDTEIDCTPQRVDNPQFDGWRITNSGWHYALGKDLANHGDEDGWVGFGGRQGAHWFKFRLLRVGYLHWPTRAWDDIGGAPNYNRANLSRETNALTLATKGESVNASATAEWESIWTTPGGGRLDAKWVARGYGLKEEITINQTARGWIEANRPPSTPIGETWFGFVFDLDWSDIPKIVRAGVQQQPTDDFADDDEQIELKDALDRLLAFMPLSNVRVVDPVSGEETSAPLRKRFWNEGGKHYLLVGVRCDTLNGMPSGDLVFDPTVDEQVGAGADDGYGGSVSNNITQDYLKASDSITKSAVRFQTVNVPASSTIDVCYLSVWFYADTLDDADNDLDFEAADDPADFSGRLIWPITLTGNPVTWTGAGLGFADFVDSPSLVTPCQAVVDRGGWAANQDMVVQIGIDKGNSNWFCFSYEKTGNVSGPKLHIEYSAGAADLSVSVSDSISAAESLGRLLALNFPGVSDSVSLAESIISSMLLTGVGVSDSISLAESIGRQLISLIGVSDSVGIAEATAAAMLLAGISVSDSVGVAENLDRLVAILATASDSISIAEAVSSVMSDLAILVSDTATLAEAITAVLGAVGVYNVSVSDTIALAESIQAAMGVLVASASDTITLAEALTVSMLLTGVSVSDTITVAESIATLMLLRGVSVSDTITVAESIATLMLLTGISVSDSVGVAEAIAASMLLTGVNVSDAITLAESVATSMLLTGISVSDSINVAESLGQLLSILLNTSESISLSETVTASMLAALSVSDSVTVTESQDHLVAILASTSDSISIAEAISALMSDLLLSVSDTAALAEAISISLAAEISVSDTVALAEAISAAMGVLTASASDTVALAEAITTSMLLTGISVSDSISLAELIAASVITPGLALAILVSDAISLSESMTAVLLAIVSIGLTLQARSLGLTLQQRDIDLTLRSRQ